MAMTVAGFFVGGTGIASAQTNINDDVIVVTGSILRSKNQDFETPSPIQTVDQTVIKNTGAVKLQDLFKGLTVNSGSQIANRQNALQGISQFSLRGLGIGSTLTLINGRRAGLAPVSDNTGQLFTDANAFPVNMIDRIDVLTDSASATYGSEAVAGVVNIITRKNFEGAELTGEFRTSTHESYQLGAAVGHGFERGHFSTFVNYYTQGGNFRGEFDFIKEADMTGSFADLNPGTGNLDIGAVFLSGTGGSGRYSPATATGATINFPGSAIDGLPLFERSGGDFVDPDCIASGGVDRGDGRCRFNFIDQRRLVAEEDRIQIFSQFDYELTDRLSLDAEVGFSRNKITDALGGGVLDGDVNTPQDGGFLIRGTNPYNYFVNDGAGGLRQATTTERADSNTVYADIISRQRPLGSAFDGRCESADDFFCAADIVTTFNNFRVSSGLDYELSDNWILNGNFTYSNNSYRRSQDRDYSGVDFQAAIESGRWNPFASAIANPDGTGKDGSLLGNTQDDLNLFANTITNVGKVTQAVAELTISGDTGLELGGGNVAVALGGQFRELGFEYTPDGRRQSGNNGRGETERAIELTKQDVYSVFTEVNLPFSERLETQLALRYEDYGDQGGSTIDPKISAKFDLTDNFAVRGSWGTSFQAPSIRQVSGASGNAAVTDPESAGTPNAIQSFNVTVLTSGSADLKSQSAENLNIGAILKTDNGLKISADFWTYDYTNLILPGGSAQSIVDAAFAAGGSPNVVRNAGQLREVRTSFENRGDANAQGFDINARYTPDWWSYGDITFDASTTIVTKFKSSEFTGLDGNGDIKGSRNNGNAFGSVPDVKFNLGATLVKDAHVANVSLRHIAGYTDDQSGNGIDANTTVDARYALNFDELLGLGGTTLTVGVVNLFDVDPPRTTPRPLFDTEVHDPRGRQIYVGFKQGF